MEVSRYAAIKQVTLFSALINLLLGMMKILLGGLGHSAALVADGVHSLVDILADGFVLMAAKWGSMEADHDHPYGHRRFETIATFAIAVLLIITGFVIGYDSAMRLWHHEVIKPHLFTIVVALVSVVGNEGLFWYTIRTGKRINSQLLIANAYHARSDSLTSIVVLFGLVGAQLGWVFLDAMAAILVGVYIVKIGVEWGLKALNELTDAGLSGEDVHILEEVIDAVPGVLHSHKLRTRKMAEHIFLDVHIQVEPYLSVSEGHYVAECVRVALARVNHSLHDITVHVDIEDHPEGIPVKLPPSKADIMSILMPHLVKVIPQQYIIGARVHYFYQHIELEVHIKSDMLRQQSSPEITLKLADFVQYVPTLQTIKPIYY